MSKRTPRTKFPTAATVSYQRELVKMVDRVGEEAIKLFDLHLASKLVRGDASQFIIDGIFEKLGKMFGSLKKRVGSIFSQKITQRIAKQFVNSIDRVNRRNFEQQARVQGIDLVKVEPWLNDFLQRHISNNVSYIKNLEDETYGRIEKIVREHIEKGSPAKVIRDAIVEQTNISKNRAEFLAVDQAGSILGQMTAERHQRLGIEKFKWDTSGDERVRDSHRKLDGKVFSYDDPPEVNGRKVLPGEDYRCRCVAIPVFDDEDEFDEPNFLRINASQEDYPEDYKAIQKELEMIPENHRNLLKDVVKEIRIIEDRPSYYNRKTGVVSILKDMEEGELIHELGHAIETKIDYQNNKTYQSLIKKVVSGKQLSDIFFDPDYPDPKTRTPSAFLKSDKFISQYQGYLYIIEEGWLDDEGFINPKALGEYFAEGYKTYILNPKKLEAHDIDLYNFIKGLE